MPVPTTTTTQGPTTGSGREEGEKNIWVAAGEGDLERVQYFVDRQGVSPTIADQWTYTPLHAAASYGQVDVLRYLLRHPSAPENAVETTDEDGDTPLFAVEDVRIARLLVEEFHANAKHENHAGNTAAAQAEENENDEVAEYLRSVTGEAPMYQRLADLDDDDGGGGGDDDVNQTGSATMEAAIDRRTDALMDRVQEILRRAEERGAGSGEELTEQEESELRQAVGESVLTQIREGWGAAVTGQANPLNGADEHSSSDPRAVRNGNGDDEHDDDDAEDDEQVDEEVNLPGR